MTIAAIQERIDEIIEGLDELTHVDSSARDAIREKLEDVMEMLDNAAEQYGDDEIGGYEGSIPDDEDSI